MFKFKILLLINLLFLIAVPVFAQSSPDAIAIRVIPNPNNYSALRWYSEQGFSGSPQSIIVDGYEAVRDGRTIYVNAANLDAGGALFTNIYLISYNQEAEQETVNIVNQIANHWHFNSNISDLGNCVTQITEDDCEGAFGCWHFENDATDSSGQGNHGTPTGISLGEGMMGRSYEFNGGVEYVSFPDAISGNTSGFTISIWAYPEAGIGNGGVFELDDGLLRYDYATSQFRFYGWRDRNGWAGDNWNYVCNIPAPINTWTNIVITATDTSTQDWRCYKNGEFYSNANWQATGMSATYNYERIGAIRHNTGEWRPAINGRIDELKIYKRVFSAQEILEDYGGQCLVDVDCSNGYCNSPKARITRDVKRMADLADIKTSLENYKIIHGRYPDLASGSYLQANTTSVWPSWRKKFGADLGFSVPVDPINELGNCGDNRFDPETCWDANLLQFADGDLATPELDLPSYSKAYSYRAISSGDDYFLCASSETGLINPAEICNSMCMPFCFGRTCGSDGCGGNCPPGCNPATETCVNYNCLTNCATAPDCHVALANASVVAGYCPVGSCYQCDAGFHWNGAICIQDCIFGFLFPCEL
ncbi:MAG: LamG domain-containing protein [Candidatus Falkowbacteria bacterium]